MKTTMATVTSKGKPVEYFMASLSSFLKANDLEAQRVAFEKISQQMYALAAENQWGITLYKQYCPMAFDNEGAYWLSAEEEIMNPYFGDQMLHCGTVQETLAAK